MNSYLFVTIPEKGHLNPMIGSAQYLAEMGHEVSFVASADLSDQLRPFDLEFFDDLVAPSPGRPTKGAELISLVQDKQALSAWVQALLCDGVEALIQNCQNCFEKRKPNVIVLDPLLYAPALAAHKLQIPWVALSNSMNPVLPEGLSSELLDTAKKLDAFRYGLLKQHSLETTFRGCDILSPYLNVAFTTPSVSGYGGDDVQQVGPTLPKAAPGRPFRRKMPSKKLVYISFGSQVYHWPAFFERAIEACGDLDVELVISAGDLANQPHFQSLPDWVRMFEYAPQLSVLEQADLFITHGGANSFMEAIRSGVPMIMNPICNDQFHQAFFLKQNQLGVVKEVTTLSVDNLRVLFQDCLESAEWYTGLEMARQSYQSNGSRLAAEKIEKLC
ncbi:MAG: glycosyltransferase [Bdellovibrionales bacterium]|nr:glycosyltransferase [Bdellovibrionales bacterium]